MLKQLVTSLAFVLGTFFLLPVTVNAKELELKDYGNGFIMPAGFNLMDSV